MLVLRSHVGYIGQWIVFPKIDAVTFEFLKTLAVCRAEPGHTIEYVAPDVALSHTGEEHIFESSGLTVAASTRDPAQRVVVIGPNAFFDLLKRPKPELL